MKSLFPLIALSLALQPLSAKTPVAPIAEPTTLIVATPFDQPAPPTRKGPINGYALRTLRDRLSVPMLIDAGLGLPSHACQVMEWGFDGVLLNSAVALAQDPVAMAGAFASATQAGRDAFLSGAMAEQQAAQASTPVLGTPFWHQA